MSDPIQNEDGSPAVQEPLQEKPFNHPMSAYQQQQGVDNPVPGDGESEPVDPRQAIIDSVAAKNTEDRQLAGGEAEEGLLKDEPDPELEPGLQTQEQMHPEDPAENPLDKYAEDPLAEFIELGADEEPLFRTVINGQQKLIPLERARAQLQKHESADVRLQEASKWQKDLSARETTLQARENEVQQKLQTMHQDPAVSADPQIQGATDEDLETQARDVVSGLFTGTEEEAATKLAKLLKDNRGAPSEPTQTIDPEQIVQQATAAARQQITAEQQEMDISEGYQQFIAEFPDIAADDMLFKLADGMTDTISTEHPEWMPSKVMLEAGKRVSDWVEAQAPAAPAEDPDERTMRKQNLRRMPRARQGVQETEDVEEEQTPTSYLDEVRRGRGQAV